MRKEIKSCKSYVKLSFRITKLPRSSTCPTGANEVCVVGGQVLLFFGSFLAARQEMNKNLALLSEQEASSKENAKTFQSGAF